MAKIASPGYKIFYFCGLGNNMRGVIKLARKCTTTKSQIQATQKQVIKKANKRSISTGRTDSKVQGDCYLKMQNYDTLN
jgi:hypothetical protein